MNTPDTSHSESNSVPEAAVSRKKNISLIWVVPVVAVLIAAGLIVKYVTEKGPTVTITFKSAEGLEAGKTKVKYKDLEVGEVESIDISDDLTHVTVTAQMAKNSSPYLTEKANFWVVRARLRGGVASGLSTIFSGAYIAIEPGRDGAAKRNFKGLEIPPAVTADQEGRHFKLRAPNLGSLDYGSPIYYRQIRVGQVSGYQLKENGTAVDIRIFIEAPYDRNVVQNSRFWVASGLDIDLNAQGLRIDTASVVSMLIGGIAFANPTYEDIGRQAEEGQTFPLFDDRTEAMAQRYIEKDIYLLKFNQSVRGLSVGAPVEFRGFPIGEVVDMDMEFDWKNKEVLIPVKIEIEPERLRQLSVGADDAPKNALEILVDQGLRAQARTGNLLTGKLYVALDFFDAAKPAKLVRHEDLIEIPTIPAPLSELSDNLTALMERLKRVPVEEIGDSAKEALRGVSALTNSKELKSAVQNLDESLQQIKQLTAGLNRDVPVAVQTVAKQATETLVEIESLVGKDSAVTYELERALKKFADAAQALHLLADRLERHPESLLKGKGSE